MTKAVTLEFGLNPTRTDSSLFEGFQLPWEVSSYREDFNHAHSQGGIFDLSFTSSIRIQGPDAKDFLQRMTTLNFRTLELKNKYYAAFLTGKATVIALGFFEMLSEGDYLFTLSDPNPNLILEHIEKYHFTETFTLTNVSDQNIHFGLWDLKSEISKIGLDPLNQSLGLAFWTDPREKRLTYLNISKKSIPLLFEELVKNKISHLGLHLFEYFRIESGITRLPQEIFENTLLLEANWNMAISPNKGCYPGQEVIERIHTYGSINQKALPLCIEGSYAPKIPASLTFQSKEAGKLVALQNHPESPNKWVGIGYIKKDYWNTQEPLLCDQNSLRCYLRKEQR